MADPVTGTRPAVPACASPGCGARQGDPWCYTATGFRRHWHDVRTRAAAGQATPSGKPAGSLTGRRPSGKQFDMLCWAIGGDGSYEVSGYTFHGDAQRRAAMAAMTDPARGWFQHVKETVHGTLFQITPDGRAAAARYEAWMNARPVERARPRAAGDRPQPTLKA